MDRAVLGGAIPVVDERRIEVASGIVTIILLLAALTFVLLTNGK